MYFLCGILTESNISMNKDIELFVKLYQEIEQMELTDQVAEVISPNEVWDKIDISLEENGTEDTRFLEALRKILLHTPKTASKSFFNQLFGGRQHRSLLGDLLASVLNNSMYTYKVGGPMIAVEKEILRRIASKIGYDHQKSDGMFAPGGSMTNMMGLLMARDYADDRSRFEGVKKPMTMYTSTESHYSNSKNAAFAGIGRDNVRYIEVDRKGRMIPEKLKEAIEKDKREGFLPCMVNATCGTTVLCAFDPLREIGEVCQEYGIWFHVDGALGASVMFSDKYKHLVDGSHLADSFSINAHKLFNTPLSCSIIVVKDKSHLYDSFSNEASYLYQTDDDAFNPGKISMQCGRRNDALKFWTLWKSIGDKGLGAIIDHQFEMAAKARKYVKEDPRYTLYHDEDSISVCFNYKDVDPVTLCNALYKENKLMVGFGKFREDTFVRLVTVNSGNDMEDIKRFFTILETFAELLR